MPTSPATSPQLPALHVRHVGKTDCTRVVADCRERFGRQFLISFDVEGE